jgi:Do/DeqQ family serine protease
MRPISIIAMLVPALGCDACPPIDRAHAASPCTIADVAEMRSSGVVNMSATRSVSFDPREGDFGRDLLFRFFFGIPDEPQETTEQSRGSAVIISSDGLALTNHHLVDNVDVLAVTTAAGKELQAEIVGLDPETDLALIRLQGDLQGIVPLPFGDSAALRPGELVVAVGNSFGFGQTITAGVVSGKGRSDLGIVAYEDFIQTDAAINPGNSGGALLNMRGELVGINTALLTKSGAFEGVGLAIPSNLAKMVAQSLAEDGRVIRGYLGAAVQDLDTKLARALRLPSTSGALVSDVVPDSPAEAAGLLPKDLITSIDGEPVTSARRCRTMVAEKQPGKTIVLGIQRGEARLRLSALMTERTSRPVPTVRRSRIELSAGIEGWPMDEEAREMLWVPRSFASGLVVANVRTGSPAWRAGVRGGDVVVAAGEVQIESVEALDRVYLASTEPILLRVVRRGTSIYLVLDARAQPEAPKS